MKWNLLFSDMLSRLLGVVGMLTSCVYLIGAMDGLFGQTPFLGLYGGLTLFSFSMSGLFLFPSLHDMVIEQTLRKLFRIPFILICAVWAAAMALALMALTQSIGAAIQIEYVNWLWPVVAVLPILALAVIVFPMGLGYRDLEADRLSDAEEAGGPDDWHA